MADASADDRAAGDGLIGKSLRRPNARRLVWGRGRYTDDLQFPRMAHVAFVRSPHAHARILGIESAAAAERPGVVRIVTGGDMAEICRPWSGTAAHLPALKSPPQYPLAVDVARWQGEPVAAVVAESRAEAEDAAELVEVTWEELPAIADPEAALARDAPAIHSDLDGNLAFQTAIEAGDAEGAFARADVVVEHDFHFDRQTGVPLEPRGIIADYDPAEGRLTVHQSHQSPFQQQDIYARQLGIPDHKVRVICPDIGGAFGIKLHAFGDELAVAAIARMLGRPVKYVADRLESFVADTHARDQRVRARMGVTHDGRITALDVDALSAIGPYSGHRRVSIGEGMMAIGLAGAPYDFADYQGRLRVAFQNKAMHGVYRAVGQPIACTLTEQLLDLAGDATGLDAVEIRRRNYLTDDQYPLTTPGNIAVERLSLQACLDRLLEMMDYDGLRAEQAALRGDGVHRGLGIATFVELTAVGAQYYGPAEARVSTQDGCTVKLEPSGRVRCLTSATEQGQGTWTGIAQIVATRLGVAMDDIEVAPNDTGVSPYGGGAWASRGLTIAGEAAHDAAGVLRDNILALAGAILQADPGTLDISGGAVRDAGGGAVRMTLAELAEIGYFRHDTLPPGVQPELAATRHHAPKGRPYALSNGIQASWLEVDTETGFVRLLDHWVVEDCGRVVNPLLVDEQIRGGTVQGIGSALFEQCRYDANGQLLNGTLADYLVPMAGDMPEIHVGHVETPVPDTALGTKGAGEAGTVGAGAAVFVAVNDALKPFGARVRRQPITPAEVLGALRAADTP